jgi:hypothetical protein
MCMGREKEKGCSLKGALPAGARKLSLSSMVIIHLCVSAALHLLIYYIVCRVTGDHYLICVHAHKLTNNLHLNYSVLSYFLDALIFSAGYVTFYAANLFNKIGYCQVLAIISNLLLQRKLPVFSNTLF